MTESNIHNSNLSNINKKILDRIDRILKFYQHDPDNIKVNLDCRDLLNLKLMRITANSPKDLELINLYIYKLETILN